jgi:hypothetical protein
MQDGIEDKEDVRLQFARQLYERCLEQRGEDHEETRLVSRYISDLESLKCSCTRNDVRPATSVYI